MSKKELLLEDLQAGCEYSAEEITALYGIVNPYETIRNLREEGYCVYSNRKNGVVTYRIGTPSKRMISSLYKKVGSTAFGLGV